MDKDGGDCIIRAEGLQKRFGETWALRGVDLAVRRGAIVGLLGPNGAGKTTIVRILATLLCPDAGRAEVAGLDVVTQAHEVRRCIGLAGQQAAVDEYLPGRANLEMVARLHRMGRREARRRADELLERFDLMDAAHSIAKTYSGGMRRRLDLAVSLVVAPPVLFLDEPTTGLDPRSRAGMWDVIEELVEGGTTLLLTTQYLEEADRLADQIVVIDSGRVAAMGTPDELKRSVGGVRLEIQVRDDEQLPLAGAAIRAAVGREPVLDAPSRRLTAPIPEGGEASTAVVRRLGATGVVIEDIAMRRPTLDEVFLDLTGHGVTVDSDKTVETDREENA